jgi:hypothetical protein
MAWKRRIAWAKAGERGRRPMKSIWRSWRQRQQDGRGHQRRIELEGQVRQAIGLGEEAHAGQIGGAMRAPPGSEGVHRQAATPPSNRGEGP